MSRANLNLKETLLAKLIFILLKKFDKRSDFDGKKFHLHVFQVEIMLKKWIQNI